ncbi:YigZ family protein [Citricoccus sp.]|uniref:IMPACT family protein n=1 Tax=Citricoccus sp. TaxID=1978372 RepID=UPI0028BEC34F|nr:YigZ family protein [Citricoccus sp.]
MSEEQPGSRASRYTVLPSTTISTPIVHELEIKRSRFIGHAVRVTTEEEASSFIAALRRQHHDARHVCSAFILGPDRDALRSSDDGEPAGTAGVPMLEALSQRETRSEPGGTVARDLSDVCVAVVRYFGGVKLGAGGLVRAYSDAVSTTLDRSATVTRQRRVLAGVDAPHAEAGRWENELRAADFHVQETRYGTGSATLVVALPDDGRSSAAFTERLASVTAGAGDWRTLGTEWVDVP